MPPQWVITVAIGEVSTLYHERFDDSVEGGAFITKTLLSCGKSPEVFGGLWRCLAIKTDHNPSHWLIAMSDIKVDLFVS